MEENNVFETYGQSDSIQISLCIPVYNVRPYLENLIDSIISQNLTNISCEILFVDDCSTDGSFEYLCENSRDMSNIRILRNDNNSGISYTRNRLIDNAKGEYIWFIDSDDMIYPNAIKVLLHIAKSNSADIVLANYIKVSEDACPIENIDIIDFEHRNVSFDNLDWLPDKDNNCRMLSMCRGIFKKSFLESNNLRFNEKVIMKEDALLYYEIGMKSPMTIKCEFPCYCVRQRASSAMHGIDENKAMKYYSSSLALLEAYQRHLDNNNYNDVNKITALIEEEKEQLVKFLLRISNSSFVRKQLNFLRGRGLYPYKTKQKAFKNVHQFVDRLLPQSAFFWFIYFVYRVKR